MFYHELYHGKGIASGMNRPCITILRMCCTKTVIQDTITSPYEKKKNTLLRKSLFCITYLKALDYTHNQEMCLSHWHLTNIELGTLEKQQ